MVPVAARDGDGRITGAKAQAILTGAMREFLAHGYAATSMDRVAAAAHVSKVTVYSHFGDKEQLFRAMIEQLAREKYAVIFGNRDDGRLMGTPQEVLNRLVGTMLGAVTGDPQLLAFVRLIIGESGRFPELAQAFVQEFDGPLLADLGRYLASRPELGLSDPQATARVLVGTVFYFAITQELLQGKAIVPLAGERLVAALVALLLPDWA